MFAMQWSRIGPMFAAPTTRITKIILKKESRGRNDLIGHSFQALGDAVLFASPTKANIAAMFALIFVAYLVSLQSVCSTKVHICGRFT